MTKTFRLTIDFKAEIKEYIQGIKNKKVEEFTREIIRCFLSDEKMLKEFIKLLFHSRFLYCTNPKAGFERALGLKTVSEILLNFLPKLSPETSFYLKTMCCLEYKDFEYEGEDGTTLDLILEHFSLHVMDGDLTEIGDAANKEDDSLVMEEALTTSSSHDEARI